jgi:hypothetical protein
MSEPTPPSTMDLKPLDPSAFTDAEETAINMKGAWYYRACDAFVRKLPDGGSSYCIRQASHEDNNHIDWSGHCTGSLTSVGESIDEETPNAPGYIPTVEGGVAAPPGTIEQDPATDTEGYTVTLSVGCKTLGEVDRTISILQSSLAQTMENSLWTSLSFYNNSED